ncbi:hypothetical protein BV25DRAFT_979830 [Artomyces pyxidatus]|uniref:Uncharacterized protein n=1 Tax=Artomyces pyxidatus TaxID=48021 RepID=A0ACB8SU21_9AGAM|nr:hypothetical protein BV25DRAFT_979830 [Artomyces pyxidatus]
MKSSVFFMRFLPPAAIPTGLVGVVCLRFNATRALIGSNPPVSILRFGYSNLVPLFRLAEVQALLVPDCPSTTEAVRVDIVGMRVGGAASGAHTRSSSSYATRNECAPMADECMEFLTPRIRIADFVCQRHASMKIAWKHCALAERISDALVAWLEHV